MATWLKQSTAVEIKLGPFVDSVDGNTAETGLTIEDEHVDLAKNGGDWGDKAETTTCVHESQGWYRCLLDTTDTNTLGILIVKSHVTGALPVWREFMVVTANVYDSLIGGGDTLDVQVTGIGANVITATAINADAFTAAKFAADVTTELQSGLATASALATLNAFVDTEVASILAAVDTEVAAILADTNELQTDWVDGGRLDLILDARASQTSVDDLPTNAELATSQAAADDATLAQIALVKAQTDLIPSDPADASVIAGRFDTLDTSVADLPTNAELATALAAADDAVLTAVGDLPTNAELATALGTADDAVLAQVALVKAQTDLIPSDPADASVIAGRFDTLDTSVADLPTNAELTTALGTADNAILAILGTPADTDIATDISNISAGSGLDAAGVRDAIGLASANLDTQLGDLPTNAELATSQAAADDATLAQIALVKTETDKIAAVKSKTDSLTYTVANVIDAHIKYVAGEAVTGAGTEADPWGP